MQQSLPYHRTLPVENSDSIIEAIDVHKDYDTGKLKVQALRGVSLRIRRGEVVAVIGPSGCGKTTLLNCLSGLDSVTSGVIKIAGQDIRSLSDRELTAFRACEVGFVFQTYNLLPVLNGLENVELPLLVSGVRPKEARERALASIERVGLRAWGRHRPAEMSGGQRQRFAIARALATNPSIVWADEPTGALDSQTSQEIIDLMLSLNREHGLTFVWVTHALEVAMQAQRLITMHDGLIEKDRPVDPLPPPSRGSLSRASAEQTEPVAAKKDMNVMDTTLFGLTPTMLAFGLAILTGGALLVVAGLGASNPLLVRMGLRNMVRRPSQTLILLAGLVLSTVLITASFGLQDSFAASQTRYRLAQAGNMDEAVSGPFSQSEVSSGLTRLRQMPEVQTATAIILQRLAAQVTDVGSELTTPGIDLFAVPPAFDQVYGPLTTSSGQPVHFADLRAGEVFLSPSLAQIADLHLGQTIQVQMGSLVISARVRAILAHDIMPLAAELGTDGSF